MTSYKPVTAALRVLEVLASVNRLYGRATVGDIHQQTSIDKSTIVRMLETLVAAGYVVRSADTPRYSVTGKTLMLSASFDKQKAFGDIVASLLKGFRETIGWPSDVALFDHNEMLVIESSRLAGPLSFNRAPGFRAPVLGTSLGLAYIAYCTPQEREGFLATAKLDEGPWNEVLNDRSKLDAQLAKIRKKGFAVMNAKYSRKEYSNRIFSIGVPIRTEKKVFASINVIYLKQALSPEKAEQEILRPLKLVADKMAKELERRAADPA